MTKSLLIASAFTMLTLSPAAATAEIYCSQADAEHYWKNLTVSIFQACIDEGEREGRDIDGIGKSRQTLLETALYSSTNPNIVQSILELGANPNFINEERYKKTPVSVASQTENPEMRRELISILVDAGADLNLRPNGVRTVFANLLTTMGRKPITTEDVNFLIEKGADFSLNPDPEGDSRWGGLYMPS